MLEQGMLLDGKYEILTMVGEGGMSRVYLARDNRLNKQWAVKEMKEDCPPRLLGALKHEADILKKLNHPVLPGVIDILEVGEGKVCVVMEFVEGISLGAVLKEQGAQREELVIKWGKILCDALSYLHSRTPPIIYRDMKPDNIMVKEDGSIKLIDFGIAREYIEKRVEDTQLLGTGRYAAPEQFGGAASDVRTDIYGLGVTLYHLVTGQLPEAFPYDMPPARQLNPRISTGLEKILQVCMDRKPERRYQTGAELKQALEHVRDLEETYIRKKRQVCICWLGLVALTVLLAGVSLFGRQGLKKQNRETYQSWMNQGALLVTESVSSGEISEEAVIAYEKAIHLRPEDMEAYEKLLNYYIRLGRAKAGVERLEACITEKSPEELSFLLGRLYFHGIAGAEELAEDYGKAYQYFAGVKGEKREEASLYRAVAEILSREEVLLDWEELSESLEEFSAYNETLPVNTSRLENHISVAAIYLANRNYFYQTEKNPFDRAAKELEQVQAELEFLHDETLKYQYSRMCYEMEGEARLLQAVYEDCSVRDGLRCFEKALALAENDRQRLWDCQKLAECCRLEEDWGRAKRYYEKCLQIMPDRVQTYVDYGLMLLIETGEEEEALALYQRARTLSGAKANSDFRMWEQRLKNNDLI